MEYEKLSSVVFPNDALPIESVVSKRILEGLNGAAIQPDQKSAIATQTSGEFENKSIFLSQDYDYVIGYDSWKHLCLIILKKGTKLME